MTVAVTNASDGPFVGNGTQTAFPFTFDCMSAGEVAVYVDGAHVTSGITVALVGSAGGTATFATAPAAGKQITISSNPSFLQGVSLQNNGAFLPAVIEGALDRLTIQDISLRDNVARAIVVPPGQTPPAYADLQASLRGLPGINGPVGSSAGDAALAVTASGMAIAAGITSVPFVGYSTPGKGAHVRVYNAAVDSAFVAAHPRWSHLAADGRGFWMSPEQQPYVEAFGAAGDSLLGTAGTDDYAAFAAAMDWMWYFRGNPSGNSDYRPAPTVRLAAKGYRISQTLILDRAGYSFIGTGNNFNAYGGTYIYVDAGLAGCVVQCWDDVGTGLSGTYSHHTPGTDPRGGQNTYLADITFYSRGGTVGDSSQNGLLIHTSCRIERVHARNFGGNGIACVADVGNGTNANASSFTDCGGSNCGLNGYYDQGGDSNAGRNVGFQAFSNRGWGIYAANFLGQIYDAVQADGNGILGAGPSWATNNVSAWTNYGGHKWYLVPGQATAASTTQPGTNAAVWVDMGAGSTSLGGSWVSGQTFFSGGGMFAGGADYAVNNNAHNSVRGYAEGNQLSGWANSLTSACMPGFAMWYGPGMYAALGAICSPRIGTRYIGIDGTGGPYALLAGTVAGGFFEIGKLDNALWNWSLNLTDNSVVWNFLGGGGSPFVMHSNTSADQAYALGAPQGIYLPNGAFLGTAAAMPTTGKYAKDSFIHSLNQTISAGKLLTGWKRLTAPNGGGTNHVAGTDWTPIYGTTS